MRPGSDPRHGRSVCGIVSRYLDQLSSGVKLSLKHYPLIGRTIVGENGQNDRYFYLSVRYFQGKCFSDRFSTDLS